MLQILASLKIVSALAEFIEWAVKFFRDLAKEQKIASADSTHAQNQSDIDAAFSAPAGGLPGSAGPQPGAVPVASPSVPSGSGGSTPVG